MGADETVGELLDVGALPPEDDPIAWETATSSGNTVRYRSPTANEMSQYGWTHEHLLVVLPTTNFTTKVVGGQATATAYLPIHDISQSRPQEDLDLAVIPVSRQWSHNRMPYYEKTYSGSSPRISVSYPTLSFYVPTGAAWDDLPERSVAIMASSRGGIQLYSGTVSERVSLIGPYKASNGPFALDIALPTGTTTFYVQQTIHETWSTAVSADAGPDHLAPMIRAGAPSLGLVADAAPDAAISGKCLDGLDNDPDGYADECDYNCVVHEDYGGDAQAHTATNEYSKDFALMGDLEFCTCVAPGIGEAVLAMYAVGASGILNNVQPAPPYEPEVRAPPFRLVMPMCEFLPPGAMPEVSCEAARACHDDNTCPGALASYPLKGFENDYSAILEVLWAALDLYVDGQPAAKVHPVHLAGVVVTSTGLSNEAGAANVYNPDVPAENGAFVVYHGYPGSGGPGANIAHEIGHTHGLAHENGEDAALWGDTFYTGFMTQGNGFTPILNEDLDSEIDGMSQGEVWRDYVTSKFIPRASGFAFTACDDNDPNACQTGHPGLQCVVPPGICI